MVEQARAAGLMPLENGNQPARPGLSEAARANMEEFLDTLYMVLPTLGVTMFTSQKRAVTPVAALSQPVARFQIDAPKMGLHATAILGDGEFIVELGAVARIWIGQGEHNYGYRALQDQLLASGVMVREGDKARFTANYAFNSPSAAATVVFGRPANGRTEWKHIGSNVTLHTWEAGQLTT
jgi:hypothetical protein